MLQAQAHHPLPEVQPQTRRSEVGPDSLELMEFVFAVEDHFKLRIPEERLDPRNLDLTVGDVCKAIADALGPAAVS